MFKGIELYSDTMTRPSVGMRQAMANAEVGDEQKGEDPTTHQLEERVAKLLGQESALFFPSATMANEVAIKLHCRPGDELLAAGNCHLYVAETGGPAVHASVMTKSIPTPTGIFSGKDIEAFYPKSIGSHYPEMKLVSVENTTNMGGGIAWGREELSSVVNTCRGLGIKLHLDGARLFNASVKTGMKPSEIAAGFDTVTICLSKGLGCPTGALLAFPKVKWPEVRRLKQQMGGSMRQSGMLAAAGLYALDNHVARLEEDHLHARRLADLLSPIEWIRVENSNPSTNMVYFQWQGKMATEDFLKACEQRGLRFSPVGGNRIRAVTSLEVNSSDIDKAAQIIMQIGEGK